MRTFALLIALFIGLSIASMANSLVESVIDNLTTAQIIGLGIILFSALFIFTVMNAQTDKRWNLTRYFKAETMESLKNVSELILIVFLFAVTAVILIAIADTGPDSLRNTIKSLPRIVNV